MYEHYPLAMKRGLEYAEAIDAADEAQKRKEGFVMHSEPEQNTEQPAQKKRGRPRKEDHGDSV